MGIYNLKDDERTHVFWVTNDALLGRITPEIRNISIDYDGQAIYLCVYSASELSEKDKEQFDIAATEIMAGIREAILFPVKTQFFVVPMSERVSIQGKPFFRRKEPRLQEESLPKELFPTGVDDLSKETRGQFLDETHRALLWRITPEIRAVSVDYDAGVMYLYVYSDTELSEKDKKEFDLATTEIVSGIIEKKPIAVRFCVVPMPEKLSIQGVPFFQRKEAGVTK